MGRYPRAARSARIKCIPCNAPVVENVEGEYVCVECGESPVAGGEASATSRPSSDASAPDGGEQTDGLRSSSSERSEFDGGAGQPPTDAR